MLDTEAQEELKEFCKSLHSRPNWVAVMQHIDKQDTDFEVKGVRFINSDHIDRILD